MCSHPTGVSQTWFAAAFQLTRLLNEEPDNPALRLRRCGASVQLGRWKDAGNDLVRACQLMTRKR